MTTAPHDNRPLAGAHAVFSVRSPGPGSARPLAVAALLDAVRAVVGVRNAELRTAVGGDRTLHVDLVDGADGAAVAWSVTRILDERLGVEVDQTRSVLVDDSVDEGRGVPLDGPQRRVHLERLQVVTGGLDVRVDVALATSSARVVGSANGPAVERTVLRTVAGATLNAVDALLEGRARCGLDQAELTDIGSDRLAVAVVTLLTPGQVDRLAGVALVRGDARQAMVRAVLSALNRRFESLLPESSGTSSWTATSFPSSTPPLSVENTATYRTIMAGPDFRSGGPGGSHDPAYDVDPEPEPAAAGTGTGGYPYPSLADPTRSGATEPETGLSEPGLSESGRSDGTRSESAATQPDPVGSGPARAETPREPARGGRAARRAAAAARGEAAETPPARAESGGRAAARSTGPEYAPSTPFISPTSSFPESIAAPTGELELASGPGDAADLGDWAAATWDRLVHNDVIKDAPEPTAAPRARTDAFDLPRAAAEPTPRGGFERASGSFPVVGLPEPDARSSGDLSAATSSALFLPPQEPEAYTPPEEPVWSWPTSESPSTPAADWSPPRWDEPADEQPGNVSSPYGRSANGAAASGLGGSPGAGGPGGSGPGGTSLGGSGLGGSGLGGSGLGGSYLEREYGGLGAPSTGAAGGRGRHGRSDSPVSGQPAPTPNGYGTNGSGANGYGPAGSGPNGYGTNGAGPNGSGPTRHGGNGSGPGGGYGTNGYGPSGADSYGGLGGPSGSGGPGGPSGLGGPGGLGGQGGLGGPAGPGPGGTLRDLGGLGPASGSGGYGGLGPAPTSSGPLGPGAANPQGPPPRRRHAAEPTGTWPLVHDPLGPSGSWADPQLGPPNQREPSPAERGYRPGGQGGPGGPGGPGDRREQPGPRARRRYADEENGRHGGGY